MTTTDAIVIGAGAGGLSAAIALAARGVAVTMLEGASAVGGKIATEIVAGREVDSGPTVMTMRWVFDELLGSVGLRLEDVVQLERANRLARHFWPDGAELDLFADIDQSASAIEATFGSREADGYRRFAAYSQRIFNAVNEPFMRSQRPGLLDAIGASFSLGPRALLDIDGYRTLMTALGDFFHDPRLLQLFGRYATYAGSNPYAAPATLNVIAHVEREGLWLVRGGMIALAKGLQTVAERAGVRFRFNARVASIESRSGSCAVVLANGERLEARSVVFNGDAAALDGLLGKRSTPPKREERSLSAITWAMVAETNRELVRHNVFFSSDYAEENAALFDRRELPQEPTTYICAQDRDDDGAGVASAERLLVLVNAPADGDVRALTSQEIDACEMRFSELLSRSGLRLRPVATPAIRTPAELSRRFPATGGALYGLASHGWKAPFSRPAARSSARNIYLAGGSVHPGAGVPMAATSGMLAAKALIEDRASIGRSFLRAMPGGTSMR